MATKRARPTRARKPRQTSARGLRARCVVRLNSHRPDLGGIATSLFDELSDNRSGYAVDVLLTEERQRVTYGAGKNTGLTVVYRGREGMVIWDAATRSVATMDADMIPRTSISPARSMESSRREDGKETVFTIAAEDASLGSIRHELTISGRREWAPFGPALLAVLHCGPACHVQSGLPWDQIAQAGLITRERTFAAGADDLISEIQLESIELVTVSERDFAPPSGFQPLEKVMKKDGAPRPAPRPDEGPSPTEIQTGVIKQALEGGIGVTRHALHFNEKLTPDCLGSTRFGAVTASLHQDFLTVAANAINIVAPLLGPTTIAGGSWTIPWLANLAAVNAASATAPGSGIFCFLRQPRVPTSPPGAAGGGTGLLDRLAFSTLYQRDAAGTLRTQREFAAGTLPATLATWGVGPPTDANLLAASGDLTMVSLFDQRVITEGYETGEVGVFSVTGLPGAFTSFSFGSMTFAGMTTPPLFTIGIAGLTGTVNFASLGAAGLVTTATIGSSGNFVLGLSLPTATLRAIVLRAVTPFGGFVLSIGTLGFCLTLPFLCPLAVSLVVLAAFVLTNITLVTATAAGVTWTFDVRFDFDPATERVEPFVSLIGRTGAITVGAFGLTPNIIANAVDALIATFGNIFDAWGAALAEQGRQAIEKALRDYGLHLPVAGRQNELRAIAGGAQSSSGSTLQLTADVRPIDEVASHPFTTQVITRDMMRQQLLVAHLNLRRDVNPLPPAPPPGPGPALTAGTFVGLGLSQNALNYYIFQQWIQKRFEVTIVDPAIISTFVSTAPTLFARSPVRIHIWPATAPRVEVSPFEIGRDRRPLIVFFDDVRACFEVPNAQGTDGLTPFVGVWELSCNFKTSATIDLSWPWVFGLRIDPVRAPGGEYEPRTWEFIDPNVPAIMGTVGPSDLAKLVDLIADLLIAPVSAVGVQVPASPRPWTEPLPATQQLMFPPVQPPPPLRPQQAYLEMLARRKALYVLPVIDTTLLELVDGSGAPFLNTVVLPLAMAPGPFPVTLRTMRCAQGTSLRNFLLPLTGPPAGP